MSGASLFTIKKINTALRCLKQDSILPFDIPLKMFLINYTIVLDTVTWYRYFVFIFSETLIYLRL